MTIIPVLAYILTEAQIFDLLQVAHEVAQNLEDESACEELAPMVAGLKAELLRRTGPANEYR